MTATDLCRQLIIELQLSTDEIRKLIADLTQMINGEETNETEDHPPSGSGTL